MMQLTKWMLAPALATCFLLAGDAPSATAQGFGISFGGNSCGGFGGGYSSGYGGGYSSGRSFNGYQAAYPSYRSHYAPSYRASRFHNTSHYDYHPTQVRRHGNHFDVIPGHYDLHRTGHYHH